MEIPELRFNKYKTIMLTAVLCSLFLAACFSPWQGNQGTFSIGISGGRALIDGSEIEDGSDWNWLEEFPDRSELWHTILLWGPEEMEPKAPVQYGETVHFSVVPGDWEIKIIVHRFDEPEWPLAEGTRSVHIHPGPNGNIIIPLHEPEKPEYCWLTTGIIKEQTDEWLNGAYGTVIVDEMNVISGSYPLEVIKGTTVRIRAEPNPYYSFVKWVKSQSFFDDLSDYDEFELTIDEDMEIFAVFDGDGIYTPKNITSFDELAKIGNVSIPIPDTFNYPLDGKYALMADMDFDANLGSTDRWKPIGDGSDPANGSAFTGSFDGRGHCINLGINKIDPLITITGTDTYTGLFGYIGNFGIVKNIKLTGSIAYDTSPINNYFGAIAGRSSGTIENISSSVRVTLNNAVVGYTNTVGGIAGDNMYGLFGGIIRNCYNTGDVNAENCGYAGGIAGNNSGKIFYSWTEGEILGGDYAGGIAGRVENTGTLENCVALGSTIKNPSATGYDHLGRIAGGYMTGGTEVPKNNYANIGMLLTIFNDNSAPAVGSTHDNINGGDVNPGEAEDPNWWYLPEGFGPGWANVFYYYEARPWIWDYSAYKQRPMLWFENEVNL